MPASPAVARSVDSSSTTSGRWIGRPGGPASSSSIRSAYRSHAQQVATFESLERAYGTDYALASAARPGHSEHQLGTAIDVDGGDTWLATHAWRYGFVVSYPPEWSPSVTCYKPEPWHLRYMGREAAAAVHDSGLSLREWLWDQQD